MSKLQGKYTKQYKKNRIQRNFKNPTSKEGKPLTDHRGQRTWCAYL